jgi:hypothetical protein
MNDTRSLITLIALSGIAAGGCATVFKSKQGSISVTSDTPGARIMLDGNPVGSTPANVPVSNDKDAIITVEAHGHRKDCSVKSAASTGWIVADIFLTSGLGLIIDWVTHNWNDVGPTECHLSV